MAINPDKDVYLHNENGVLNIGVLDSTGMPTCDAEVVLDVIRPDGTTTTLDVRTTPDCGVMEPGLIVSDYMSEIYFYQTGIYTLVLRATTDDGVHTLTQEVQVQDNPLFVVTRHSATRLYPVAPVMMQLSILFYEDFEGDISDFVPSSFFISPSESYITQELDNREIQIIWKSIRAQS